ncbi:MAG TPA: winged helix DNA-binding domain-containing protein [Pseudonocardiaceae bacterium]|nr:winged helix DNA-binding domain-containing protein [Pseudonocardiaceae bacterium]
MTDDERRARLATRHALSPACRAGSPDAAVRALTALHATEPASVYLSCWARVPGFEVADLDRALYDERSLVKQLAMRRTLFVLPRDLLPAVWPSASARVATILRARMTKQIVRAGLAEDGGAWLDKAGAAVLAELADVPEGRTGAELRAAVPMIDVRASVPAGAPGEVFTASNVLVYLGVTGEIVRATNSGRWHTSRPRWTLMRHWLGEVPPWWPAADGYSELVRRWLFTFGPGTEDDLVWWLGATRTAVRAALAGLDAVTVRLADGGTGWLLPDDVSEVPDPGHWVALLPVLDPTVMGWRDRDFYLGPHRDHVFDSRGNAGTTAWADGRIVGCWVQDDAGVVRVRLLEPVPAATGRALDAEAERLTAWLGGLRVRSVYSSPAMRG